MEGMNNYIGVKIIKSKPGTLAEAQAMKCKCKADVMEGIFKKSGTKNEDGYIVMYPDGHVSWSPKEAFEKAYRPLDCEDFIMDKQ